MAWGYGPVGWGWWRTANIINRNGEEAVGCAVEALQRAGGEGPVCAWRAWSSGGEAKLPWLGTAFAGKVAYFSSYDRAIGRGPLIADENTAWALWALAGIGNSRATASRYGEYVEWAAGQAARLGCRSDDIERALFTIGPTVLRSLSNREHHRFDTSSVTGLGPEPPAEAVARVVGVA